jgi:hypothetical protein
MKKLCMETSWTEKDVKELLVYNLASIICNTMVNNVSTAQHIQYIYLYIFH